MTLYSLFGVVTMMRDGLTAPNTTFAVLLSKLLDRIVSEIATILQVTRRDELTLRVLIQPSFGAVSRGQRLGGVLS